MVIGVTDSTVTLSWMVTPEPNGGIIQYVVQYRRTGTSSINMRSFTIRTGMVTQLTEDREYVFRVAAVNEVGIGPFTTFITQRTGTLYNIVKLEQLLLQYSFNPFIDGPPINVDATVLSPNNISVTWDPPSALSSVINYIISYNGVEPFAVDSSVTVDASRTIAILYGLEEFVNYGITVQAVYSGGTGPTSDPDRETTWSASK